jgi:hypothetical protein
VMEDRVTEEEVTNNIQAQRTKQHWITGRK